MADRKMLMDAVRSTDLLPDVRLDAVRQSGAVLFEYVGGSTAYGTKLPTSDVDLRGVFCFPPSQYLSTTTAIEQIADDREADEKKKNDDIFYSLRRFFELLKGSRPNVLEALWVPADCVVSSSPEFMEVIENRSLFVSKACIKSHYGYADGQFKRSSGAERKCNNPASVERPKKLDFCRIIPCVPGAKLWTHPDVPTSKFPFRPIPLKDMPWVDLKDYHVAAVEHMANAYRLYCYYGDPSCKGVFRGDDMLACSSIPMDDEHARFSGILLYDETEYDRALKAWNSYWTWHRERNPERWADHKDGKRYFNAKNMAHCMRLLMSGINIVRNGDPLVRLSGKQLEQVMDIRTGKTTDYDVISAVVAEKLAELRSLEGSCSLPEEIDFQKVESLYEKVSRMAWKRLFGETWTGLEV